MSRLIAAKGRPGFRAVSRGGGEAEASVGCSPAASSSVGHPPSLTEAAHSSGTYSIYSGGGRLLRNTLVTEKCGVKVSVAVGSKLLQTMGSERFIFNSLLGRCCEGLPKQSW